ncbi:hypothetical protein Q7O_000916 [Pectobacterium carotovorum subsp. carotovorum PCCS1]|jgi:hypothetical protein|nr:hypothetical protein [Pectobacterium carotovorum subsp. carotovorum PCCS1]
MATLGRRQTVFVGIWLFFICLRVAEASPFLEHKRLEWYGLAFFKFIL